jgi:hypothetical protein
MLDEHVGEKFLAFAKSEHFKPGANQWPLIQIQAYTLARGLTFTLIKDDWKVEKPEFHNLVNFVLEFIDTLEEVEFSRMFHLLCMLVLKYWKLDNGYIWDLKFPDEVGV